MGPQADVRDAGRQVVVTWLPVTINPAGTSNGAPVTGYVVYADGRNIKVSEWMSGNHDLSHELAVFSCRDSYFGGEFY